MDVVDFYGAETMAKIGIVVPRLSPPYTGNYDTQVAADLLGYTRVGVLSLLHRGKLLGIKVGSSRRGQWWIPAREITRFLAARAERDQQGPTLGRPRLAERS